MKTTKTTRTNKTATPVLPTPAPPPIPINPGCKFTVKVFGPTDLTEQYDNVDIYEIKANVTQFGWAETKDGTFSHIKMIVTTLPVLITPVPVVPADSVVAVPNKI